MPKGSYAEVIKGWRYAQLGLTQVAAARLLAIDGRTSRRWAQHDVRGTAEILLRFISRCSQVHDNRLPAGATGLQR